MARRLSFTKAAAELGVTQAAVSRQIQGLERELGFALFRRLHRRVELTERGRVLSGVLSHSFNLIDQTIASVRAQSDEDELVIGATSRLHPALAAAADLGVPPAPPRAPKSA